MEVPQLPRVRPKALIFVDFDMLVRHFILSGAFCEIESRYDVVYVAHRSGGDVKQGLTVDLRRYVTPRVEICDVPRRRMGLWYLLFVAAVLRLQRGKPAYAHRRGTFVELMGEGRVRMLEIASLPGMFQAFRFVFKRWMGVDINVAGILDRERPDIILHPSVLTGPFINELLQAGKARGIPYVVLMNSWDNPATKAVVTDMPTVLGVWGEHSARLAREYMGLPDARIRILGAAQFEVYRTKPERSREELCDEFGVPSDRRIVLYAGSGVGKYESDYLERLDAMTRTGGELDGCHVIYRPHPWRGPLAPGEKDFEEMSLRNVSMDPTMAEFYRGQTRGHGQRGMYLIDYAVTNRLLSLAEAVISPLSTILLEGALNGRPILVLAPPDDFRLASSVNQPHFRDLVRWPETNLCSSADDFEATCRRLRGQIDDADIPARLRTRAAEYVDLRGPGFATRLADLADQLVRGRA